MNYEVRDEPVADRAAEEEVPSKSRWLPMVAPSRVYVMIRSLANGGAERQSVFVARALAQRHETRVIVMDEQDAHPEHLAALKREEIPVIFLQGHPLKKFWLLVELLRQRRPRALFAHLPGDTTMAALAGRLARVPHVFGGIRNAFIGERKLKVLRVVHNHLLSGSISNSFAGRRNVIDRGFRPAGLLVVPNAIHEPIERPPRVASSVFRIVTVGRFVEQKDYQTAIRAVAGLRHRLPRGTELRYQIVGHGPLEGQLREWVRAFGLDQEVEITVNPERVHDCYAAADLYLSTSRFEGLSNSLMEAMAHWLPVVATDVGDTGRLVEEGKTGYLIEAGDADRIADRLSELAHDPAQREAMGTRGRTRVHDQYSFDQLRSHYLDLVKSLA